MNADTFNRRLEDVFGGRLRLRWSDAKREWHIEQKVGRGVFDPPLRSDGAGDRKVRARDGYSFVMAIQQGDRMRCPLCSCTVRVPKLHIAEAVCAYCVSKGRDSRQMACYFPLGETLIDHLRKIDPLTEGVRRQRDEADRQNQQLQASAERKADQELHYGLLDAAVDQIPAWGYGGMKRFEG